MLDVLYRSKDVEKAGTGFQRMDEFCKENKVKWTFRKEGYGFFFEFLRTDKIEEIKEKQELSELEEEIALLLKSNIGISKKDLSKETNKSEKTIQRVINSLINKGLVVRVGSNKTGFWKVIER